MKYIYEPESIDRKKILNQCIDISLKNYTPMEYFFMIETGCIRFDDTKKENRISDGESTKIFLKYLLEYRYNNGMLISIDNNSDHIHIAMNSLVENRNVAFVNCDSVFFLQNNDLEFGFAYLDSAEDSIHGYLEFLYAATKIRPNGYIALDNAGHAGCDDGKKGVHVQKFLNKLGKKYYTYFKIPHGGMLSVRIDNEIQEQCRQIIKNFPYKNLSKMTQVLEKELHDE